jgi:hypothetical protein
MVWEWTYKPKTNHHFSYGTKGNETSATKTIYNRSTHSYESGWTNQQIMSNVEDILALKPYQDKAKMMMRGKAKPTSY